MIPFEDSEAGEILKSSLNSADLKLIWNSLFPSQKFPSSLKKDDVIIRVVGQKSTKSKIGLVQSRLCFASNTSNATSFIQRGKETTLREAIIDNFGVFFKVNYQEEFVTICRLVLAGSSFFHSSSTEPVASLLESVLMTELDRVKFPEYKI